MRTKQFIRPAKDKTIFSTRKMKFKSTCCLGCLRTCAGNSSQNKGNSVVKATVSEYVRKSTIHGMAYVGDDERNKFERLGWLVMLLCSVIAASYSIYRAYRTMKDNPIIESTSLGRTPRWAIPFPAVTVCPVGKIVSNNFLLNITYWPDSIKDLLPDNSTDLIDIQLSNLPSFIASLILWRSDQNDYDILTQFEPAIKVLAAYFGSLGRQFKVPGRKMITTYGACMTFNMYPEKALYRDGVILSAIDDGTYSTERLWSRDTGFSNDLPQPNYTLPIRSFSPTDMYHFALTHDNKSEQRFHTFDSKFYVIFHAPDEVPQINRGAEMILIKSGTDNQIDITPHLVASEGIEHYQPAVRQCYYTDERYLKFYKGYTQSNCETECFANYTLARCECVDYHLPHFNGTKLCLDSCGLVIRVDFYSPDFTKDDSRSPYDRCNCLPSCTQLLYTEAPTFTLANRGKKFGSRIQNTADIEL